MRSRNNAVTRKRRVGSNGRGKIEWTYACSGHRPDRLGGYDQETYDKVSLFSLDVLRDIKPSKVYVGMALGFDMSCANACRSLKIPYIAAVPFAGWDSKWPISLRKYAADLLKSAYKVVYVSPPPYSASKLHRRNQYMIDNTDALICLWDGKPYGGTYAAQQYATRTNKTVIDLWERWIEFNKGA